MNYLGKINSFVQVGVHDGVMHDPMRKFSLNNNWQGIFIEPQRDMLEKCQKNYQNIEKHYIFYFRNNSFKNIFFSKKNYSQNRSTLKCSNLQS